MFKLLLIISLERDGQVLHLVLLHFRVQELAIWLWAQREVLEIIQLTEETLMINQEVISLETDLTMRVTANLVHIVFLIPSRTLTVMLRCIRYMKATFFPLHHA